MASVGFSYARIYVQQKHQRERLKKREEERPSVRREKGPRERKPSHKVYPGGVVAATEPAGGTGVGAAASGLSVK